MYGKRQECFGPPSPFLGDLRHSGGSLGEATSARWDSGSVGNQVQHPAVLCSAQHWHVCSEMHQAERAYGTRTPPSSGAWAIFITLGFSEGLFQGLEETLFEGEERGVAEGLPLFYFLNWSLIWTYVWTEVLFQKQLQIVSLLYWLWVIFNASYVPGGKTTCGVLSRCQRLGR